MSRAAKATLLASVVFAGLAVWGVHAQQRKEQETMYMGVIRDEARQAAKKKQREEELRESLRKREIYERVQTVGEVAGGIALLCDAINRLYTSPHVCCHSLVAPNLILATQHRLSRSKTRIITAFEVEKQSSINATAESKNNS
ncbi:hypothetical protein OPQ81_007433 [Rhizoctonia solani]|nr:hypothetical protein OPQ81_007433 [Rhizoctonia solani]